jgi:hypothetical protein
MRPKWQGWIKAEPEDKPLLLRCRVRLGKYDSATKRFVNCFLSDGALAELSKLAHLFTWAVQLAGPPPPKPEPKKLQSRMAEFEEEGGFEDREVR